VAIQNQTRAAGGALVQREYVIHGWLDAVPARCTT
jgi:hypothetical protein